MSTRVEVTVKVKTAPSSSSRHLVASVALAAKVAAAEKVEAAEAAAGPHWAAAGPHWAAEAAEAAARVNIPPCHQ